MGLLKEKILEMLVDPDLLVLLFCKVIRFMPSFVFAAIEVNFSCLRTWMRCSHAFSQEVFRSP
jgi:hypothetical protein